MTEHTPTIFDLFAEENAIHMTYEYVPFRPDPAGKNFPDKRGNKHSHWKLVIKRLGRQMTTFFSMGGAYNRAPVIGEVLESLQIDIIYDGYSFDDWSDNMGGGDMTTYKACLKVTRDIKRILGDTLFEEFTHLDPNSPIKPVYGKAKRELSKLFGYRDGSIMQNGKSASFGMFVDEYFEKHHADASQDLPFEAKLEIIARANRGELFDVTDTIVWLLNQTQDTQIEFRTYRIDHETGDGELSVEVLKSTWRWLTNTLDANYSPSFAGGWNYILEAYEFAHGYTPSCVEDMRDLAAWLKNVGIARIGEHSSFATDDLEYSAISAEIRAYSIEIDTWKLIDNETGNLSFDLTGENGERRHFEFDVPDDNVAFIQTHGYKYGRSDIIALDLSDQECAEVMFAASDVWLHVNEPDTLEDKLKLPIYTKFRIPTPSTMLIPFSDNDKRHLYIKFCEWFGFDAMTQNHASHESWNKFRATHRAAYEPSTYGQEFGIDICTPEYLAWCKWIDSGLKGERPDYDYNNIYNANQFALWEMYASQFPQHFHDFCEVNGLPEFEDNTWAVGAFKAYQDKYELPFAGWRYEGGHYYKENDSSVKLDECPATHDPDKRGDGIHVYVDDDSNAYCPFTGLQLQVSSW